MRRLLVVILPILAVLAACSSASSTPGWTYAPAPSATPVASGGASGAPGASAGASAAPSAAAPSAAPSVEPSVAPSSAASAPAPSSGASGAPGASGSVLTVTAPVGAATAGYTEKTLSATANTPFTIHFDNQDNQAPHNVALKDSGGTLVALGGDITFFQGPGTRDIQVPALTTGTYTYFCQVHPSTMIGTLTVQ
jgi:plastocyanin